jgi:threonine-phosphate decarboxylase
LSRVFDDETGGHGGDLARAESLWNREKGELIDFSSNINPLGPPPGLLDLLRRALPEIVAYPTPQARELRDKLAHFLDVPAGRLLLGNGANELIHLLLLWRRPRRVLLPAPSFSEYERAARLAGSIVEHYPLPPGEDFDPALPAARLEKGDLLIFCNPHNPSGTLYSKSDLLFLIGEASRRGAEVMIDESFIPLTGRPEESLRGIQNNSLWIVISLTKVWSLPGLRLGCCVGPTEEIREISRWGDPWRVNSLAQKAGLYCLGRKDYLKKTMALIEKEREFLTRRFRETGAFKVFDGSANFLLLRGTGAGFKVADYQEYLAKRGVLIRRADNFTGLDHRYFRIAVRKRPENLRLLQETELYLRSCISPEKVSKTGGDLK